MDAASSIETVPGAPSISEGNFTTGSLKVPLLNPFNAKANTSPSSFPPAKRRDELAITVMDWLEGTRDPL